MLKTEPDHTAPTVTCSQGTVSGIQRDTGAAFLGIPFAQPPVGDLRFQAPVPVKSWDGLLQATEYGPTAQKGDHSDESIPEPSIAGDDILTLNVFTPAVGDTEAATAKKYGEKLPVMVWIHGGAFRAGSPASPWYDGAAFNRDGVVTLTVAYRLGFDGFGVIDGCPNNRGLLDMICALEWVRDNIAAFGGDPERVTIAGQSAGGGAVTALLVSPKAKGLFHQVIAQSPYYRGFALDDARSFAARLADILEVEPTLKGFSSVDADAVLDAQTQLVDEFSVMPFDQQTMVDVLFPQTVESDTPFAPVADDDVLPTDFRTAMEDAADIPLLLGCTDNEFTFFGMIFSQTAPDVDTESVLRAGLWAASSNYLAAWPELQDYNLLGQVVTERKFRVPTLRYANYRGESSTWLYNFALPNEMGLSFHCGELPFTFDCLDAAPAYVAKMHGDTPPQELADVMHADWVQFITDGSLDWGTASDDLATRFYSGTRDGSWDVSDAPGYQIEQALLPLL